MSNQRIAAGGYLDIPTKEELAEAMGHKFDTAIQQWYRGVDYLIFTGNAGNTSGTFTIPDSPESGYSWSVKLISVQVTALSQVSFYLAENNQTAPIASIYTAQNGTLFESIASWSANQVVVKDNRTITVFVNAANIGAWRMHVKQVPTEMQGKL